MTKNKDKPERDELIASESQRIENPLLDVFLNSTTHADIDVSKINDSPAGAWTINYIWTLTCHECGHG